MRISDWSSDVCSSDLLCRPDGSHDDIGCKALVLACSGFGGAADMVASLIPEMGGATYHGHPGNRGDAIRWGEALGAGMADFAAYQGHGGLAAGHGIPILLPLTMNGDRHSVGGGKGG